VFYVLCCSPLCPGRLDEECFHLCFQAVLSVSRLRWALLPRWSPQPVCPMSITNSSGDSSLHLSIWALVALTLEVVFPKLLINSVYITSVFKSSIQIPWQVANKYLTVQSRLGRKCCGQMRRKISTLTWIQLVVLGGREMLWPQEHGF